jgi:hypothetical protein
MNDYNQDIKKGQILYGYFPMSEYTILNPSKITPIGFYVGYIIFIKNYIDLFNLINLINIIKWT